MKEEGTEGSLIDTQPLSEATSVKTFSDEDKELFRNPIVQTLLEHLPKASLSTPVKLEFPIAKRIEDGGKFIIAGYASVEVIDQQNELIPIPVLKEAWVNFKKSGYKIGSLMHSNIPIISVLDEYKDSKGQV